MTNYRMYKLTKNITNSELKLQCPIRDMQLTELINQQTLCKQHDVIMNEPEEDTNNQKLMIYLIAASRASADGAGKRIITAGTSPTCPVCVFTWELVIIK